MTRERLQRLYSDFLTEEGYKPYLDKDGDVQFKREGRTYFIAVAESDSQFFRVVLANFWEIESEKERAQVIAAADASNGKSKVAKIFTVKDNVWACVELFLRKPEDFKGVFTRMMSAIDYGVAIFVAKMRE
jgi:hypothetical protein